MLDGLELEMFEEEEADGVTPAATPSIGTSSISLRGSPRARSILTADAPFKMRKSSTGSAGKSQPTPWSRKRPFSSRSRAPFRASNRPPGKHRRMRHLERRLQLRHAAGATLQIRQDRQAGLDVRQLPGIAARRRRDGPLANATSAMSRVRTTTTTAAPLWRRTGRDRGLRVLRRRVSRRARLVLRYVPPERRTWS